MCRRRPSHGGRSSPHLRRPPSRPLDSSGLLSPRSHSRPHTPPLPPLRFAASRQVLSLRRCEAVAAYGRSVITLLTHEHSLPADVRAKAKRAFQGTSSSLAALLREHTRSAEGKIKASFDTSVAPQLKVGAADAQSGALSTAQAWGQSVREGGLHWATYKATTRRSGVFRVNMNEELVAPILRSVSTQWERSFISGLSATLDTLQREVGSRLTAFDADLAAALAAEEVPASASDGLRGVSGDGLLGTIRASVGTIREAAQKQQRDLSRALEPSIKEKMEPGYTTAFAEAGTGSHRRRVSLLEGHVRSAAPEMFDAAAGGIVSKLGELRASIASQLESDVVGAALRALTMAYAEMNGRGCCLPAGLTCAGGHSSLRYTPLWDEVGEQARKVRRELAPEVHEILFEADAAVRKLKLSFVGKGEGGEGGGEGGKDDDDLVDVTEEHIREKRKRQAAETIDLDEYDENAAPQAVERGAAAAHAPRRAKTSAETSAGAAAGGSAEVFVPKGDSADAFVPKGD